MAEFVEFRVEEMIPELETLERHRIFNEGEIRNIIKTRKKFQYKIHKQLKCVDDFVRYILYEMDLMRLVKTRRIKLGLTQKKNELEMVIANRVNKLFEQAIFRFHDDIQLWLSYMKFCKQVKVFSICVSNMLVGMLAVHSHKPSLWKLAATWEFEENKSIENACQFLVRGLRHHPNSKILYAEAFRLQLIYVDRKLKELESKKSDDGQEGKKTSTLGVSSAPSTAAIHGSSADVNQGDAPMVPAPLDPTLQGHSQLRQEADAAADGSTISDESSEDFDIRQIEFIYETACKKISDVSFLINLLNIAKNFSFTEKLQARMARDLLTWFPNDELTWNALARRELEGLHFYIEKPAEENVDEQKEAQSQKSVNDDNRYLRIRNCYTIFQRALQHVGTKRMWGLYLDTLIEINQDHSTLRKCKRKLLISAFEKAHEEGHMQEKYYIHWAGMYLGQKDRLALVLDLATSKCSNSVDLWYMRLRHYLSEGDEKLGMVVFKLATVCLGTGNKATLPLWKMLVQYYQTKSVARVKEVYEEGIKQGSAVSSVLKQMYLEWLVLAKNINVARQVYQSICDKPPFCVELHQKMAALECIQPEVELPRVIRCYELACEQSGKNNTDVWMEYVKFEIKRGDPKKVKEIYLRALNTLNEELAHNFISEFCALLKPKE